MRPGQRGMSNLRKTARPISSPPRRHYSPAHLCATHVGENRLIEGHNSSGVPAIGSLTTWSEGGELLFPSRRESARQYSGKSRTILRLRLFSSVVRAGIEPATHGFSVHCSTN